MASAITRNLKPYDRDVSQAGVYCVSPSAPISVSTLAWSANQARFTRFSPSRALTVTSLSFEVTTLDAADPAVDVGIYNASLARLVSSGATTGIVTSTGVKNIAVTATSLTPGSVYYAALSCASATPVFRVVNWVGATAAQLFGSTAPQIETFLMASAHPLPSSATVTTAIVSPFMAARE